MKIKNTFLTAMLISFGFLLSQGVMAADGLGYQLNTEYKKTDAVIQTGHKKSVIELFSYFCPHCYHLEDSVDAWRKTKPKDVVYEQVPAVFDRPNWIFFARVFYTAKELGILKQSHKKYFDALHRDHKKIFNLDALAKFYTQFGVTETDYRAMFKSFKVEEDIKRAAAITKAAGIDGVPAIIVNGHYMTDVGMAGGTSKQLWKLVDTLVQQ